MQNIFHIQDGFYDDPVGERKKALDAKFENVLHNGIEYKGVAITEDPIHHKRIQDILGMKLEGPSMSYYRCNLKDQEEKTYIHSDSRIGSHTAVTYLTPRELCSGGTAFWRHKKYGWQWQPSPSELKASGIADTPELWKEIYEDGFDESKWDLLDVAEMRWNRCVIFSSMRFHSRYPKVPFGETTEDGRLSKVFFLNPASRLHVRKLEMALDYNEVSEWWTQRQWPTLRNDHLSPMGIIAEDDKWKYCAAWIYRTDSAFGLLEWIVSNPKAPMHERHEAMNLMVKTIKDEVAHMGIKTLFINCKSNGLIRLLEKHGFKIGDTGMTNLTLSF